MSRIRLIKPRVPPPKDKPVQWFRADGESAILKGLMASSCYVSWCLPAQLDGTPSGPVHSLEAQELPADCIDVGIRVLGRWFEGFYDHDKKTWSAHLPPQAEACLLRVHPDAWRPLPDDEPGDAELLDAARRWAETYEDNAIGHRDNCRRLSDVVKKRGGK